MMALVASRETVDLAHEEAAPPGSAGLIAGGTVLVPPAHLTVESVDLSTSEGVSSAKADEEEPAPADPFAPGGPWHYAESVKGRIFMITTDWVHPDTGEVLITPAVVEERILRKGNLRTAWINHDKDPFTSEDGLSNPRAVVGAAKPAHVHIVEERKNATTLAAVARAWGIAPNFIKMRSGHGVFLDLVEYLTHEHVRQQGLGKHRYDDSEVSANFDFRGAVDEHVAGRSSGGSGRGSKKLDGLLLGVLHGELSLRQLRSEHPLEYARNLRKFHDLRRDFMLSSPPPSFRVNYYIHGQSGAGKSVLARMFARALYPALDPEECYYDAGDPKVLAQNYGGQPVMILDDYRPKDLIFGFGSRTSVWRAFDTSPGRADINIKNGSVRMVQAVNIVTGVIPYREFLADLAGSYRSPDGTDHEAEDDRQAFRRFPFVAEVTPETFEFYANEGFFEGTDEYKAFRHLFTMRCNMRELAQTLDAIETEEGKDQFRDAVGQKVLGGMLSAHRDVRPTGSLAAADAIAILDRVATLTGTEMEDDRARRERNEADARAQAAELDKARWEVRDATPAFHG
ncbi:hypothetical protein ITJ55_07115 [Frigoribacterium sp. VKM Ac-1396]|nr:hypothetical protein [Frigoribacterium sp. VKM Ac-1396]